VDTQWLRRYGYLGEAGRPWRPWNTEICRKVRRTTATQGGRQVGFKRDSLQGDERLRRTGHGRPIRHRQGFRLLTPARMWRAVRPAGTGADGASGIGVPGTIAGHRFAGRAASLAGFYVRVLGPAGRAVSPRSPWRPLEDKVTRPEDQGAGRPAPEHEVAATGAWVQGLAVATNEGSAMNGAQIMWAADGWVLLVAVIEGAPRREHWLRPSASARVKEEEPGPDESCRQNLGMLQLSRRVRGGLSRKRADVPELSSRGGRSGRRARSVVRHALQSRARRDD